MVNGAFDWMMYALEHEDILQPVMLAYQRVSYDLAYENFNFFATSIKKNQQNQPWSFKTCRFNRSLNSSHPGRNPSTRGFLQPTFPATRIPPKNHLEWVPLKKTQHTRIFWGRKWTVFVFFLGGGSGGLSLVSFSWMHGFQPNQSDFTHKKIQHPSDVIDSGVGHSSSQCLDMNYRCLYIYI